MTKRRPYLEIIVTAAVMAFLVLVIAGSFDQRSDGFSQVTMRAN